MQIPSASQSRVVPEIGQVATVRNRPWIVSDVQQASLPGRPLAASGTNHHLVTLQSIEDDGLGEELRIVWETEVGTSVTERVGLPALSGFDNPERFDAFLSAVRWGSVSQADTRILQAPFRSGIDLEEYQLTPLARAIQMPRVNLLIADDVGLGKTVESGLIVQELIVRHRVRTVLIVCPAGLQIHWREQMLMHFGLEFRIIDTEMMRELRRARGIHANPWAHFPRLITSMDFIKRDRPLRLFRELTDGKPAYPRPFDLLIVDEAHNVAPSSASAYAVDSQRTQAIRSIAGRFEHKLFLSATPHNGYSESWAALLELLDNQRFARGLDPDEKQVAAVMVRRLKPDIKDWDGKSRFPPRQIEAIEVDYDDAERAVHQTLQEYTRSRLKSLSGAREALYGFVLKTLKKRLFSSPAAFHHTLERHLNNLRAAQSDGAGQEHIAQRIKQADEVDSDASQDDELQDEVFNAATRYFTPLTKTEEQHLEQMLAWADRAARQRDAKTRQFVNWLREIVKPGGKWSDERVIVFTEYRDTLNWLHQIMAAEGLAGNDRLMTMHGGTNLDEREDIKAAFQADPSQSPVRILLATDAASEGIDLQKHCHILLHFEIPWNPNRMEQRNGRIDRHGQTHQPEIYHFAPKGWKTRAENALATQGDTLIDDMEFLARAARKVDQMRADLGASKVRQILADAVEKVMMGRSRNLDLSLVDAEASATRAILKAERDIQRQVAQMRERLDVTRLELGVTDDNVASVVNTALALASQPALSPDPTTKGAFRLPAFEGAWANTHVGLMHPFTKLPRPIVFDQQLAREYGDSVVLAHLNHRLVQMALRLLRAEVWATGARSKLFRVTARTVPDGVLETPAVIGHARLVVIGGGSYRVHEQIIDAGGILQPAFRRMNVGQVQAALAAQSDRPVTQATQQRLASVWAEQDVETSLMNALEARMKDRIGAMTRELEERSAKEQADIAAVMNELAAGIRRELGSRDGLRQLELWPDEEKLRYRTTLEERLSRIPAEIEAEQEALRRRFSDLTTRLFPAAVTFLVPERLNR